MRLRALCQGDAARRQDFQRGRRRDGKPPVRAINPSRALHRLRRQDARTAQDFQGRAAAHDVNNGIHRAHFVEMDLLDWDLMDFCFGFGEAGENFASAFCGARGELGVFDSLKNY